jgi:hypothetical protein
LSVVSYQAGDISYPLAEVLEACDFYLCLHLFFAPYSLLLILCFLFLVLNKYLFTKNGALITQSAIYLWLVFFHRTTIL